MAPLILETNVVSETKEPELSPLVPMVPGSQLAIRFWLAWTILSVQQRFCGMSGRMPVGGLCLVQSVVPLMRELKETGIEYGGVLPPDQVAKWLTSAPEGIRHQYHSFRGPGFLVQCLFEIPEPHSIDPDDLETHPDLLLNMRARICHRPNMYSDLVECKNQWKRASWSWVRRKARVVGKYVLPMAGLRGLPPSQRGGWESDGWYMALSGH